MLEQRPPRHRFGVAGPDVTDVGQLDGAPVPVDVPARRATASLLLERIALAFAVAGVIIGVAVLVGYAVRSEAIVKLSPSLPPMYPNAAVGIAFGGLSVVVVRRSQRWRWVALAAGAVVGLIGVVGLWLNVTEAGRTWYEVLFPGDFVAATTPVGGRPVAETCVAFIFLGGALVLLALRRWPVAAQAFATAGASVGLSATVGFALGVDRTSLGGSLVYVGMALHTGIGIALVGLAAVLVRTDIGFLAQLLAGGVGGAATRRVTFVVAAAPVVLVGLGVMLSYALPTDELSQSVFSVLQVGVLGAAVLIPAGIITSTERELREQLDSARRRVEHRADVDSIGEAITDEMVVSVPDAVGWEFGMRYQPATGHIAGDSVQALHREHPTPSTLIAVLDIAGHDAYAGLVAYGLRTHIAALWEHGACLGEIADSANNKLVRRGTIASGVLLALDHTSDRVELVNAGHPPPLHVRGTHAEELVRTGPLFGLLGGEQQVRTLDVHPDDLLVLWSDGLIEARPSGGDLLGDHLLRRLVTSRSAAPTQDIADACIDLAIEHTASRLRDDAVVVVGRRRR
jgi:serine phosphatase RsbU (regulator of sigma subunit)